MEVRALKADQADYLRQEKINRLKERADDQYLRDLGVEVPAIPKELTDADAAARREILRQKIEDIQTAEARLQALLAKHPELRHAEPGVNMFEEFRLPPPAAEPAPEYQQPRRSESLFEGLERYRQPPPAAEPAPVPADLAEGEYVEYPDRR